MFLAIVLLFIVLPIAEVFLLIRVSDLIGGWNTFSLVLASGILGFLFAKREGRQVVLRMRQNLGRGHLPADSLVDGILIFFGGVLLIIPGFLSDVVGLGLLFPLSRRFCALTLRRWLEASIAQGKIKVQTYSSGGGFYAGSAFSPSPFADEVEPNHEIKDAKVIDMDSKRLERQIRDLN